MALSVVLLDVKCCTVSRISRVNASSRLVVHLCVSLLLPFPLPEFEGGNKSSGKGQG